MIILICCLAQNRVIGRDGQMPWRFSADLKHFKQVTSGNVVVIGRKTYEETGVLPNRQFVVLSRKVETHEDVKGVLWTPGIEEALSLSRDRDVFVAGGEQVYYTFLDLATYMMLTFIHRDVDGDTFFPEFEADEWETVKAHRGNRHSYLELRRR